MSSGSDTGPPAFSSESLGRAAEEAAAHAREHAAAIERERRLPERLVTRLRVSGLMRAGAPSSLGAAQAPAAVTLRCAETVARGDASAGWCVSIAATSSLLSAYLPPDGAAEIFGDPQAVAAGVWAARGTARPVDGGFRVSVRWAYCSGITHSNYLFAGAVVHTDSKPEPSEPVLRVVAIPTDELQILDTWRTTGLRGTGSHDAIADEVFVPARRTLSLLDAVNVDARLYHFPIFGFFALSIAAAALGNARGAIDELTRSRLKRSARIRSAPSRNVRRRRRQSPRRRRRCGPLARSTTRRSKTRGGPRTAQSRSRSACGSRCGWLQRTRCEPRPRSRARCATSAVARQSMKTHRCSAASGMRTQPRRTSRSTPQAGS